MDKPVANPREASQQTGERPPTVLIVEDNELNMRFFSDLLEAHGYMTPQTRDGFEAFELAAEHRPDLILMDIQLGAVSGLDIARRIKNNADLKSIPIVAVTAFATRDDEDMILGSGCDAWLAKPITSDTLIATAGLYTKQDMATLRSLA